LNSAITCVYNIDIVILINVKPSGLLKLTLTFTGTEDSSLQTSFVIDDTALTVS